MTLFERTEDFEALIAFFTDHAPGTTLTWQQVEAGANVQMDEAGKEKARRALLKAGHAGHLPLPGHGLTLSSATNSTILVGRGIRKSARAIHRTTKTARRAVETHGGDMDMHTRQSLELVAAGASAVRQFLRAAAKKALVAPTPIPSLPAFPKALFPKETQAT